MPLPAAFYRLRNAPLHLFTRLMIWLLSWLPARHAYSLAGFIAQQVYRWQPRWRRNAMRNLELLYRHSPAYLRPTPAEMSAIALESARQLGLEVGEFIRMGTQPREVGLAMVVEEQGRELLERALEQGSGVLLVGLHFGNWELAGAYIASRIAPMSAVGKPQRDEFFTRIAFPWRERYGIVSIAAGRQQGSAILRTLRSNAVLGLISDQNGGKDGSFAPFCGIEASCVAGIASLALKTGAPVLCSYCQRLEPGCHRWVCRPVPGLTSKEEISGLSLREVLTRLNACIEAIVKSDPSQWLLGHKRWKTRPPGEPSLY